MVFVRYKRFGKQEYAYEVSTYWDSKRKKPYQKTRYLGVVIDRNKKLYEKRSKTGKQEKLILDFGDVYLLHSFLEKSSFAQIIRDTFSDSSTQILALLSYRLCYGSAMCYAETWLDGSYAKFLYKNAQLTSQRISDLLRNIGEENVLRKFFSRYIASLSGSGKSIIIDATSLPNQIHIPLSVWGLSGEDIDKQIRFLLVVDKDLSVPLLFRALPGNIVDVSALLGTIRELEKYGIKESYACLDAGFFSEDNIKGMYAHRLKFLTRLPSIRCLYKDLIRSEAEDLEKIPNAVRYGERVVFIKQRKIDLFGYTAYAHIILDPERKGREIRKLLIQSIDEKSENKDLELEFMKRGIMILISSFPMKKEETVPAYYIRQRAEMMFGFSKDDLSILPLRVHNTQTLMGYLFIQFLSLIAFIQLKNRLERKYTVEEVLLTMRNLKCKVYDDELLVNEMTKKQKEIAEKLSILMPNRLGI